MKQIFCLTLDKREKNKLGFLQRQNLHTAGAVVKKKILNLALTFHVINDCMKTRVTTGAAQNCANNSWHG